MNENKLLGLAWISPYIIGLIVFTAFPFVSSFFLRFTSSDFGNDSNLLIVFYVQIMPDDLVIQLHRF